MNPIPGQEATGPVTSELLTQILRFGYLLTEGPDVEQGERKIAYVAKLLNESIAQFRPPTPAADQQTERRDFEAGYECFECGQNFNNLEGAVSHANAWLHHTGTPDTVAAWKRATPAGACFAGGSPAKDVEAPAAINQDLIDAKRYRWLRDAILDSENPIDGKLFEAIHANPSALDEALDSAMATAPIGSDK